MYAGTLNDPEKATWQTRHANEQEFGDLWGLLAKTTFHWFCLSTDDPVSNGWKGKAVKGLFKSYDLKLSTVVLKYW